MVLGCEARGIMIDAAVTAQIYFSYVTGLRKSRLSPRPHRIPFLWSKAGSWRRGGSAT